MTTPTTTSAPAAGGEQALSHRQVISALSGLLAGMFVAILSNTIVANALPSIVADLRGSQTGYTWVVTATLLATTASTPIWGKLADLYPKKPLVQSAVVIFIVASIGAGLAGSMGSLIGWRLLQGIGAGGLMALTQVVIAALIPPRERGRYSGYLGSVLAAATVSGPLLGGLLVDTPGLGWRWCFFVGVPVGLAALVVASWARYAEGVDERGDPIEVVDPLRERLVAAARRQRVDPTAFLRVREVFGDLAEHDRFTTAYTAALASLHERGARATVRDAVGG